MPANLGIPPWLHGQDIPGSFLKGAQLGIEQARLGQQAQMEQAQLNEASQKLQVQSQQAEQNRLQEQQRIEIASQYHQAQIGLQKQRVEEAAKLSQAKIQQWAQRSAAMMEANQRIGAGEDWAKVWGEIGPRAGMSGASLGALARGQEQVKKLQEARDYIPESMELDGQKMYRGSPTADWKPFSEKTERPDKIPEQLQKMSAESIIKKIEAREDQIAAAEANKNTKMQKALEKQNEEAMRRVNSIYKSLKTGVIPYPQVETNAPDPRIIGSYVPGQGFVPRK